MPRRAAATAARCLANYIRQPLTSAGDAKPGFYDPKHSAEVMSAIRIFEMELTGLLKADLNRREPIDLMDSVLHESVREAGKRAKLVGFEELLRDFGMMVVRRSSVHILQAGRLVELILLT